MITSPVSRTLLRTFWLGVMLLIGYALFQVGRVPPLYVLIGGGLAFFALLPTYLWCAGRVGGLPVFPALAGMYLLTFAFPFLGGHPSLDRYDPAALMQAALTVTLFLGIATVLWLAVLQAPTAPPREFWGFAEERHTAAFHICLVLASAFHVAMLAGLLWTLSDSVFSLIRAVSLSLATLGVTVLSYRLGRRQLTSGQTALFLVLFGTFLLFSAAGLMLAPAMGMLLLAVGTFTVGRGRLPIAVVLAALVFFSILHVGKKPMRDRYWSKKGRENIPPWEMPRYYARWFTYGIARLPASLSGEQTGKEKQSSVLERSSVVQMLLRVQSKTPSEKPYLYGQTYAIIPELLIPRVLYEDKVRSHEGTYMLSVHYGLQTRKATLGTTIGFGLLPEAYANFGYFGVVGLAVLLGLGCGLVTRWSMHVPVASFRGLFALVTLSLAVQTEHTAGVLAASLFQSAVVLLGFALLLMKVEPLLPAEHPVEEAAEELQAVS